MSACRECGSPIGHNASCSIAIRERSQKIADLEAANAELRAALTLPHGDCEQKVAAWQTFIKSAGSRVPEPYDGGWYVALMEAIKAYLEVALARAQEGKTPTKQKQPQQKG